MPAETRTNFYEYDMSVCDILIPGKPTISLHKDNILGFTIEKDYDHDFFPIFNVQLNLTYTQYYSIIENKTTVKFKIRVEKGVYNESYSSKYKEVVFDDIFTTYIDDDSAFFDKELYNKTLNLLGSAENRSSYDFYLFKENDITGSRKVINRVVNNSNMTNCIVYLLSKSGVSNLLMTPLDNIYNYNDIILPPLTVVKSLSYLEKQYGFYEHGALLFYDFNTTYFINKRAECTAYRTGEYKAVIVNVFKSLKTDSKTPGNFKDPKTKTYTLHATRDSITMETASIINDQIVGTTVNVIDTKNNNSTQVTPNVRTRNNNVAYVTNNFNNRYLSKMIENGKYENDNIINIALVDVDIDCFTPNKKFIISFEEKEIDVKHKGNYRLSYELFTFIKHGEYYYINGQVQFKKTT